ncbi:unnamed protein product [Lupinus luteus]|uniref:Uncharacterized protein n=1 Tax=Lupinus luteus TaxID=3873 RepID=A0AAV1W2T7_LUPLU
MGTRLTQTLPQDIVDESPSNQCRPYLHHGATSRIFPLHYFMITMQCIHKQCQMQMYNSSHDRPILKPSPDKECFSWDPISIRYVVTGIPFWALPYSISQVKGVTSLSLRLSLIHPGRSSTKPLTVLRSRSVIVPWELSPKRGILAQARHSRPSGNPPVANSKSWAFSPKRDLSRPSEAPSPKRHSVAQATGSQKQTHAPHPVRRPSGTGLAQARESRPSDMT